MCLIAFALHTDPAFPLLIAANAAGEMAEARDESDASAAPRAPGAPPLPAPVDAETFRRLADDLNASTRAISTTTIAASSPPVST